MRLRGLGRARRLAHRIRGRNRPVILMYHRIADAPSDPWGLCVSPANFSEQIEALGRSHRVLPLQELAMALRDGKLPRRAAAITFDDGYADNLHNAKPVLERWGAPATVFLMTGAIGCGQEFWWDELERLILQTPALPPVLALTIEGRTRRWRIEDGAAGAPPGPDRSWRAWDTPPSARHALYRELWELLRGLPHDRQRAVLDELASWANAGTEPRPECRALTPNEVRHLTDGGLIEIGAHTVTHPPLSALAPERQSEEIRRSKSACEEMQDRPVDGFAYPYGDFAEETVRCVQEAGFALACSTAAGPVRPRADPYRLPRIEVGSWNGEAFSRRLAEGFRN